MKAINYAEDDGQNFDVTEIPDNMKDKADEWRNHLLEEVASNDEGLMEKYLEGEDIAIDELKTAIRKSCISGDIVPMLCGSAFKNKGVQSLLDYIIDFLPSPLDVGAIKGFDVDDSSKELERSPSVDTPFSALAFKIMTDPFVGRLTFFRVYSGSVSTGDFIYNPTSGKKERVGRLMLMHSRKTEERKTVETQGNQQRLTDTNRITTTGDQERKTIDFSDQIAARKQSRDSGYSKQMARSF